VKKEVLCYGAKSKIGAAIREKGNLGGEKEKYNQGRKELTKRDAPRRVNGRDWRCRGRKDGYGDTELRREKRKRA